MPRLPKGCVAKSSRHIRRLSTNESIREIEQVISTRSNFSAVDDSCVQFESESNIEGGSCFHLQSKSNVGCDGNISVFHNSDLIQREEILSNEHLIFHPFQLDIEREKASINDVENIENVNINCRQKIDQIHHVHDNEIYHDEIFNISDFDYSYRYSDSEADSISDNEIDYFDVDDSFHSSKEQEFRNEIKIWAVDKKINHSALNQLLCVLNKFTEFNLPKDARTLLKTPQSSNIEQMGSGEYCHIGLKKAIEKIIKYRIMNLDNFDSVNVLINIDGAPITGKSSEKGIWTILIKDIDYDLVYLVGLYHGIGKPQNSNDFLKPFTNEALQLMNEMITYENKRYSFNIHGIICDAPAKSFILNTKYPSGYNSCTKCTIEGDYFKSVCFPLDNVEKFREYTNIYLRTDQKFRNEEYTNYQKGSTILNSLPATGLVSKVPLDSMHLVYLGVTRQLIRHWLGDKGLNKKVNQEKIKIVSERLENASNILPNDFNRRCRSLLYWKNWKATEFRHFLLYLGPAILKDILDHDLYKNFLMLHISIMILSNKHLVSNILNIRFAESLLIKFVVTFQNLYGKEHVTYNIHNLLHLAKDVEKYGPLESFSAFPFENYICILKKFIRKGEKPLQQIARRISEYEDVKEMKNLYSRLSKEQIKTDKLCRTMMKAYAIIVDEKGDKRIVPSKWLTNNARNILWPPTNDPDKIRKLIINVADVDENWLEYPVSRLIRTKDDYNEAMEMIKNGLDELESDPDLLRRSRASRSKKRTKNSTEEEPPNKMNRNTNNSESDSDLEVTEHKNTNMTVGIPFVPETLNVINKKDQSATKTIQPNNYVPNENPTNDEVNGNVTKTIENMTESDKIQMILDLQQRTLQAVNKVLKKQNIIETTVNTLQRKGNVSNGLEISTKSTETMSKYFPIDGDSKTMENVELYLKNKQCFDEVDDRTENYGSWQDCFTDFYFISTATQSDWYL